VEVRDWNGGYRIKNRGAGTHVRTWPSLTVHNKHLAIGPGYVKFELSDYHGSSRSNLLYHLLTGAAQMGAATLALTQVGFRASAVD
jgi:hypothetical protein